MRLNKKIQPEIAARFEGVLDYIPGLDSVPNYIKREAAEEAAQIAFEYLKRAPRDYTVKVSFPHLKETEKE